MTTMGWPPQLAGFESASAVGADHWSSAAAFPTWAGLSYLLPLFGTETMNMELQNYWG